MKFLKSSFLFLFIATYSGFSQTFGGHYSKIKWQEINTENVRVIFPKGNDLQAARIADVINYLQKNGKTSAGPKSKKIDLVLQTEQVISNGFVTTSPFRSEFYTTAPQDFASLGSTDWLDLLAVHEYRHVLQYSNSDIGYTKFMHYIRGQAGWGSVIHYRTPTWFLEGDAVLAETIFSENGRGRNPEFFKEQRAVILNNTDYSYMKASNGSFKDIVPNAYPLGFSMVNYVRNHYGERVGSRILAETAASPFSYAVFSRFTKKYTGHTTKELYEETYDDLQRKWNAELKNKQLTKSEIISPLPKTVTQYSFPIYTEDGSVFSLKKSFTETPSLVQIKNGQEEEITKIGISAQEFLSYKNNVFVWTETSMDPRWANKNYSNIISYNLISKEKRQLTEKEKLFSPEISFDGNKIVAVENNSKIESSIAILNSKNGNVLKKINPIENAYYSYPKWSENDASVIYLAKVHSKIAFFKFDIASETNTQITDWTAHTIGHFQVQKNRLYYSASYDGILNIYALNIDQPKIIEQISSVKIAASTPTISSNGEKMVYSEFTLNGYELREQNISDGNPILTNIPKPVDQKRYEIKTTKVENAFLDSLPKTEYTSTNYSGFFKGIKLHSWGIDILNSTVEDQVYTLKFKNILNDFSASLNLIHNANENTFEKNAAISYAKHFVVLNAQASTSERNSLYANFDETKLGVGFSIPLQSINGNYLRSFEVSSNFFQHITDNYYTYSGESSYFSNFKSYDAQLVLSNFRRTALQNIAPKFGQYLEINFQKSLSFHEPAKNLNAVAAMYLPGAIPNHSLSFIGYWSKQDIENNYQFTNRFNYARGYSATPDKEGFTLASNYELPIAYPDWGFLNFTYFKRVRANVFYDQTFTETFHHVNGDFTLEYENLTRKSYGIELMFDNTFFNKYGVSFGLRTSFLTNELPKLNSDPTVTEFIIRL